MNTLLPLLTGPDGGRNGTQRAAGAARTDAAAERPFIEILEKGQSRRTETPEQTRTRDAADERRRPAGPANSPDAGRETAAAVPSTTPPGIVGTPPLLAGLSTVGAAGLLVAGTSPGQGTIPPDLTQQIMTQLQIFAADIADGSGPTTFTLKLNPDHLGFLQVDFTPRGNQLKVAMTTASPEAEAILKEDLNRLTDALLNRVGRFQQVEVKVDLKAANADDSPEHRDRDPGASRDRNSGSTEQEQQSPRGQDHESDSMDSAMPRKEG